jgi:hypothetical protein
MRATGRSRIRLIFNSVLSGHTAETRIQLAFPFVVIGQEATAVDGVLLVWNRHFEMDMIEHGAPTAPSSMYCPALTSSSTFSLAFFVPESFATWP